MAQFFYRNPQAPRPNLQYQLGALAIIEKDGSVLMEQRVDGGQWSLIGGGLEEDESIPECMVREVKEETGLAVSDFTLFGIFSHPSRIMQFDNGDAARGIGVVFHARVEDDSVLQVSDESLQLKWIKKEELNRLDIIAMQQQVIEEYLQGSDEPILD